jgi:hypothetical protein
MNRRQRRQQAREQRKGLKVKPPPPPRAPAPPAEKTTPTAGMSFDEAVAHVLSSQGGAFSYIEHGTPPFAGEIYLIRYSEDFGTDPEEDSEYYVLYSANRYGGDWGEEETYLPDEVPSEARQLLYSPTDVDVLGDTMVEYLVPRLLNPALSED